MEPLKTEGIKIVNLKEVTDLNQFLDETGKAVCNLYNSAGHLLIAKNKLVPQRLFSQKVFAASPNLPKQDTGKTAEPGIEISQGTGEIQKKKPILSDFINPKVKEDFQKAFFEITEILKRETPPDKKVERAYGIIDSTINTDLRALNSCIFALRTRDTYTYNHSLSVYTMMIQSLKSFMEYQNEDRFWDTFKQQCVKVNFSPANLRKYSLAALLHDLGKTLIPQTILNKPGRLSEEEFGVMKKHPAAGLIILKKAGIEDREILQIVGNHHPSYPSFSGEEQNPIITITTIIDIYDALRSKRAYKDPLDWETTKRILKEEQNKHLWDPFIFTVLTERVFEDLEKDRTDLLDKVMKSA